MWFERFQDSRQLGVLAESIRIELSHVHPGAEIEHAHAGNRRGRRGRKHSTWMHGFEPGQRQASSRTA
jgi:hypothetical protein